MFRIKWVLIVYLVTTNFVFAFKDTTILVGVNTAEVFKTIFFPGVFSIGLQGQYFYKQDKAFLAGFNYLKANINSGLYDFQETSSSSAYFYIGANKFVPSKRIRFLSKRAGIILGYYHSIADISYFIPDPFYNGRTYRFYQRYQTAFLEGLFGYSFQLDKRFVLSPALAFGINKSFSTSVYEQAPSLGWMHNSFHLRFQAELWYSIR